jgi:hypothetical protein
MAATEVGHIMDFNLELVLFPVSDVDRAKDFYLTKVRSTIGSR